MRHPLLLRIALGSVGLAACVTLLSEVAKAADTSAIVVTGVAPAIPPNLSGTVTLPVKPLRYMSDWERARRDDSTDPQMQALIAPARGMSPEQQIDYVQGAVFNRVHWRSDATEWGYHDYWASAAETLQHGYGDEEDRAIVKMQALKTLGFSTRDLYLTIGNDRVGGQITVLIVRLGQRYFVLDDTSGAPFTSDHRPEFTPMLTFGYGGFWIHGYPYVPGGARKRPVAIASAASSFAAH